MRIAQSILAGSITVLAAIASPALAAQSSLNSHANTKAQAVEEEPASPGCHAYHKAADGSWVEMACHEGSGPAPTPVHGKSASHQPAGESTTR